MNKSDQQTAIPLLTYDTEQRKFVVNEEIQTFLADLKEPIGIITVAGMYRTGKSYLLNRMLLNRSSGFGVGPTINPCTKGMWVWPKPIQGFTPDGEPINILVIDTEGLGALDEDSNHDVRIFSLAILLSSYFLYNSHGSIDENALNNLSLVINLTQHIHIKSQGLQDDMDPEEYARFFPSFMWVVRDFALQLQDLDGEAISSKEYLEKALQPQKGFSEGIEQKNRIRRMLKSFFKERDCCTMIRPLTSEENLQNLANMELEELRPDFVEQVMQLRRKVINRIKPKMMNGKRINGQMFYGLVQSYVSSINQGAVPNIENAWNYICKNECLKALHEALTHFEKSMLESYQIKSPLFDEELKEVYQEAKREAIELFKKKKVGEVSEDFLNELKQKMKQKFSALKLDNEKESKKISTNFLQQSYAAIEKKLRNNEFTSFQEFEQELKAYQQFFLENGPPGPQRRVILLEFIQRAIADGSDFFIKNLANELYLQKTLSQDSTTKLQQQLDELKGEVSKSKEQWEAKLKGVENEKVDLAAREQSMKEQFNQLQREKEYMEKELNEKLAQEKKEAQRLIEEYKAKMNQNEEASKESTRRIMAAESEFDKQKALLDQKIEFLEKSITESQRKEKEYSEELKNQKKESQGSYKEAQSRYEKQIKGLQDKLNSVSEQLQEAENNAYDFEQKYEQGRTKWSDTEDKLRADLNKAQNKQLETAKQLENLRTQYEMDIDSVRKKAEEEGYTNSTKFQELQKALTEVTEEYSMEKNKWDKEAAILKQKVEFMESQLSDSKTSLEDARKSHEAMMNAIQNKEKDVSVSKEEAQKKVEQMREQLNNETIAMQKEFESQKRKLQQQVEELSERNNELELSVKFQVGDLQKEVDNLTESLQTVEGQRNRVQEQLKSLENNKLKMIEDTEVRYQEQVAELERELEEKDRKWKVEVNEMQAKSEESLAHLKNFYEQEKDRLERRITEEKEKATKRYNLMVEEYEQRLRDEQNQHEDDMMMLQDDMREQQTHNQNIISQLEHENSLNIQKIDSLEQYLKETKESLNNLQNYNSNQMDQLNENFKVERKQLLEKIENMNGDMTKKERELTAIENQRDSLKEQLKNKDKSSEESRQELMVEKTDLNDKIEALRQKYSELNDEYMQKKLDWGRETALTQQQIDFLNKKIEDLQKANEDTVSRYEERLAQQRTEYQQDLAQTLDRLTSDKDALDMKYETKRKALKEMEQNLNKRIHEFEREEAILKEKLSTAEAKIEELVKSNEDELSKHKAQLDNLNSSKFKDSETLASENSNLKKQINDLEKENTELKSNYERDQALWEGKFSFLEQREQQAKNDLSEAQKKFDATIDQLQKNKELEGSSRESFAEKERERMETQYKQQIKELTESHQAYVQELATKNKQLEKDLKAAQEKIELEARNQTSAQGSLGKKLQDALDNEKRLQEEVDTLKNERDRKLQEYQRNLDKERENYKSKLGDLETKAKEAENKKNSLVFEHEKERAKWNLERDHLANQKQEFQEMNERLEKRKEQLLRENEKLKNDFKRNRQMIYQSAQNAGGNLTQGMVSSQLAMNVSSYINRYKKEGAPSVGSNDDDAKRPTSGIASNLTTGFKNFIGDQPGKGLMSTPSSEGGTANTISPRGEEDKKSQ